MVIKFVFKIIPHLDGDIYCTLHFNICISTLKSTELIIAIYDTYCEENLLKPKFYENIQLCMIHRSVYDLI